MIIYTINYHKHFLPKPDLTRILGIPTYDDLQKMQLELQSNDISVHYNLGGGTHGNVGILMTNTKYATLSFVLYLRPVHPGILQIPNNATRVSSYELKRVYGKNFRFFHEVRGFEQALIQQVVTAFDEK